MPDGRIAQTWIFEGAPDETVVETVTLEQRDGETTVTAVAEYPSFESRKANLEAGANEGAAETYDRLADVVATMAKA